MLIADPQDATVEVNQWAQFNCTASCSYTRFVGWYIAGHNGVIKRNNTVPGLLIKRGLASMCTESDERTNSFEVLATEAFNKSAFYCAAYETYHRENSCGRGGRCFSRPALLLGKPICNWFLYSLLSLYFCVGKQKKGSEMPFCIRCIHTVRKAVTVTETPEVHPSACLSSHTLQGADPGVIFEL